MNNLANMINDSDSDKVKSVLEVNNIKINGFEFAMEDGRWKMKDGRWKMEDGRWKMEDGRWKMEDIRDGAI
jgi:hypothetical protein